MYIYRRFRAIVTLSAIGAIALAAYASYQVFWSYSIHPKTAGGSWSELQLVATAYDPAIAQPVFLWRKGETYSPPPPGYHEWGFSLYYSVGTGSANYVGTVWPQEPPDLQDTYFGQFQAVIPCDSDPSTITIIAAWNEVAVSYYYDGRQVVGYFDGIVDQGNYSWSGPTYFDYVDQDDIDDERDPLALGVDAEFDDDDNLHLVYCFNLDHYEDDDDPEPQWGETWLCYSYWTAQAWGDLAGSTTLVYDTSDTWITQHISPDIELDLSEASATDMPRISVSRNGGKYYYESDGTWYGGSTGLPGATCLALDPTDNYAPHITYISSGNIYYASSSGGSWSGTLVGYVGSTSYILEMLIPGTGTPYIYYTSGWGQSFACKYRPSSTWLTESIASELSGAPWYVAGRTTSPYTRYSFFRAYDDDENEHAYVVAYDDP